MTAAVPVQKITLVAGYHAVTPVPAAAAGAGLGYRFAVVFDTFGTGLGIEFYRDVLVEIGQALDHDALVIELEQSLRLGSRAELDAVYEQADQDDFDPPIRVRFEQRGRLVGLMETEFWVYCGGPPPYSDSYTAAFYTAGDREVPFARACERACLLGDDRKIVELIRAATAPS